MKNNFWKVRDPITGQHKNQDAGENEVRSGEEGQEKVQEDLVVSLVESRSRE